MSFWKKIVSFFAEADKPEEAVRILVDRSKSEDTRRAQVAIVESLSDKMTKDQPNGLVIISAAWNDLLRGLADDAPWVRATALRGLRELAGMYRYDVDKALVYATLSAMVPLLRDLDPLVRERAPYAVSGLCDVLEEDGKTQIANALRPLADDPLETVRASAAINLGSCGTSASPHLPRIISMLDEQDERVRGNAASALWMIGVPDPSRALLGKLMMMLQGDPSPRVRADVANAIGKVGVGTPEIVPALVRAMDDQAKDVRHFAIFACCDLGALGAPAVPRLGMFLGNPEHKEAAEFALKAVGNPEARTLLQQHGISPD
jgi:HEAT repeat protein